MSEDGNCLFRAIADQVYGDAEMHDTVRQLCCDHMAKDPAFYSQYIAEDFSQYIQRKRTNRVFENHVELQAISEIYNRPIELYCDHEGDPVNVFQGEYAHASEIPLRLSYHNSNHYNALIDPETPSIGVGLGLPDLQPGAADRDMIQQALQSSEAVLIEQDLVSKCQEITDSELTEKEIEDAVRAASFAEYLTSLAMKTKK
eukprot:TRINITY_DN2788_c0_g1_i1.p1 TRINITY_DN2788_c0_g1~~TRINITY_DN2788_c0_g1_i1.p1  ORF type:complete len:201 (-),score=42.52 TRINITY_DN2788_c0_g1_i1:102-704(-)